MGIGATAMLAGCAGQTVDLGGHDAGHQAASTPVVDASMTPPGPMVIETCADGGVVSSSTLYAYETPAACSAARGPTAPASSPADVASQVVGMWYDCSYSAFGLNLGVDTRGIELTSDGHYIGYGWDSNDILQPLATLAGDAGGTGLGMMMTGTYDVVDGSATWGPGAYELQFHPSNGGLVEGQVFVTTSPTQLHYFQVNGSEEIYTRPLNLNVRSGVCTCEQPSGGPSFENDAPDLTNAIVGKWLWCDGPWDSFAAGNIGIEFAADNTWYGLDEDENGNITRSTASLHYGTYSIVPTAQTAIQIGPEPLTLVLNQITQGSETQILYYADPRKLMYSIGTTGGTVTQVAGETRPAGGAQNVYTTLEPLP